MFMPWLYICNCSLDTVVYEKHHALLLFYHVKRQTSFLYEACILMCVKYDTRVTLCGRICVKHVT